MLVIIKQFLIKNFENFYGQNFFQKYSIFFCIALFFYKSSFIYLLIMYQNIFLNIYKKKILEFSLRTSHAHKVLNYIEILRMGCEFYRNHHEEITLSNVAHGPLSRGSAADACMRTYVRTYMRVYLKRVLGCNAEKKVRTYCSETAEALTRARAVSHIHTYARLLRQYMYSVVL